jgi:hypothetical protein
MRARTARCFAATLLFAAGIAGPAFAGAVVSPRADADALPPRGGGLSDAPRDPLAPFGFSLDSVAPQLAESVRITRRGGLRAGPDRYERWTLGDRDGTGIAIPAPAGLAVLSGEILFSSGGHVVETTLDIQATAGSLAALASLERALGKPGFEVVLPGALDMSAGWRCGSGYVLATFSDLDVFRLTAFRDDADDLLAGTQIVLFEALSDYSDRLSHGAPASEVSRDLMRVVTWVAVARGNLQPM